MRILMVLLTVVWLIFGWFCYSAIHWKEPIPVPLHVEDQLQIYTPEMIEAKIALAKTTLNETSNLSDADKGQIHFDLAQGYWLKAFIQETRVRQQVYLMWSLDELKTAMKCYSLEPKYLKDLANIYFQTADVYHVLKEYEKADEYYLKSLKINPNHPLTLRRFKQMIEESGLEDRSDL